MALNINGTTGISGVDGSASAPALQGTDSNTGINFGSDTVNINTGGTTRATFDSSGRLLVGTTTEGNSSADNLTVADSGESGITVRSGTSQGGHIYFSDATSGAAEYQGAISYQHNGDFMKFNTSASERIRIDTNGDLFVGCTSHPSSSVTGFSIHNGGGGFHFIRTSTNNTGLRYHHQFINPNGAVGQIATSGSSTLYQTSSDYRLKENAVAISDGITRLKTLKPYRFNFKTDASTTVDGFFAHEVTAVPEAISGTKDEVDSDNNPIYQGIDQSKLVPLLTAALQEAVAKIEVLETKVAALEAS